MEYRQLGKSGLRVPVISFGTGTFGGTTEFFEKWGDTDVDEARRLIDVCLDHGVNFFDTANIYSLGASEEILGKAIKGKQDQVLISTKGTFPMSDTEYGSSRYQLIKALDGSLKRLGTDYVDVYFMHGADMNTPLEETVKTLDEFVRSGKVRYVGCSNYSGWQVMKALGIADRYGWERFVAYQGYYSLVGRDYEEELMPLGMDQGVGLMVWSPLGWGRLTGKIRRGQAPKEGRMSSKGGEVGGPPVADEEVYRVVDVLDEISKETGKSVSQISLNWLLQRPTVCNIVIGARNETQLKENLGAVGWNLTKDQVKRLDAASEKVPVYPYWHQRGFPQLIKRAVD